MKDYLLLKNSFEIQISTKGWPLNKQTEWTSFVIKNVVNETGIYITRTTTLFSFDTIFHISFDTEKLRTAFILKWL